MILNLKAGMSPGIKAGRILATETQLKNRLPEYRDLFEPIQTAPGVTMYRYKYADEPYTGKTFDISSLDPLDMHEHFMIIVNNFIVALNAFSMIETVEGDEDEEFTYGAFCTALVTCQRSESDWLLNHEFGNLYSIRHIELELENDDF